MLVIQEKKLRKIVSSLIVEQESKNLQNKTKEKIVSKNWSEIQESDWTSTKTDFIDSINFKGKIYDSYGYGKTNEGKTGLAVLMPYEVYKELWKENEDKISLIERGSTFKTVKPKKGNFELKSEKPNVHVLIKWGTKNITLNVSTIELAPGAAMANKISEVLNVAGAIPVVGSIADAANVITQLKMSPPSMFGALCSLIGAIPAVGDAVVLWKVTSGIGDIASAVKAGKTLSKALSEVLGTPTLRAALKGKSVTTMMIESKKGIFDLIKKQSEPLSQFIVNIDEVVKIFEIYVDKAIDVYKYYKNLQPVQIMNSIKEWKALLLRPASTVSQSVRDQIDMTLLESSGIFEALNIQKTGDLNKDLDTIIRKLSTIKSLDDINQDTVKALNKIVSALLKIQLESKIDFGLIY